MRPALASVTATMIACCLLCSCSLRIPVDNTRAIHPATQNQLVRAEVPAVEPTVKVWLVADSFHTGMVFPYRWLLDSGFVPPPDFPDAQYVNMSWGNTDAYSQEGISSPYRWIRVLFTPTKSVMEVIPINWEVAEVIPDQRLWLKHVPASTGPTLAHFLNQCTTSRADGSPIVVRPSSWGEGVQLEGSHSYFIPRVCNIWSVQAIECLGGEINPWLSLTANGLARQVEAAPNHYQLVSTGRR